MPTVVVKHQYGPKGKKPSVTGSTSVQVSRKPPTESEVAAALRRLYPDREIIILEIGK